MNASTTVQRPHAFIGDHSVEQYLDMARRFHGYAAPGLILGGYMVAEAKRRLPRGILFDAISETSWCLPDAIQMLTPCTVGNGWLKIINMGLYSMCLYDKHNGKGVRISVNPGKLAPYPVTAQWLLKLKPKREQDSERLREEMIEAGHTICDVHDVLIKPEFLKHRTKGAIGHCPGCGQAYPARDGAMCRSCQGQSPYVDLVVPGSPPEHVTSGPKLRSVPTEQAVGKTLLHDMTAIEPGRNKDAAFQRKQLLNAGDVCRLHRMGRMHVYVEEDQDVGQEWVHEDEAAAAMALALAGSGVTSAGPAREGKVVLRAERDGLFMVNEAALKRFNCVPGVMCATRKTHSLIKAGQEVAGTRAIPLYLERHLLENALECMADGPALTVAPIRPRKVGILVTGTEVFQGLIEDKFAAIISAKVLAHGCEVAASEIVPDDADFIADAASRMLDQGVELLVTTAGLSVDPGDVTRKGLVNAGAQDMLYGLPMLPGAMTLLAHINGTRIMGVPACALYFKTTSFDILLPRVLADLELTREDLAELGHGGYCHKCKTCTYPKCSFAK